MLRLATALFLCAFTLSAQGRVPQQFRYERLIVVVPMVGTGATDDPIRPMFSPTPDEMQSGKSPFISVDYELSDDGKTALVEFVALDRSAFAEIRASSSREVKFFERGKNTKAEVEQEFSKVKSGYEFKSDRRAK